MAIPANNGESKTKQRIRREFDKLGLIHLRSINWEPIGRGAEMQGPSGGWQVECFDGSYVYGYNAEELIANAKVHARLLIYSAQGI